MHGLDAFTSVSGRDILRSVDLAIADIRRGGAVVVDGGPGQSAVMLAAEMASDLSLS